MVLLLDVVPVGNRSIATVPLLMLSAFVASVVADAAKLLPLVLVTTSAPVVVFSVPSPFTVGTPPNAPALLYCRLPLEPPGEDDTLLAAPILLRNVAASQTSTPLFSRRMLPLQLCAFAAVARSSAAVASSATRNTTVRSLDGSSTVIDKVPYRSSG